MAGRLSSMRSSVLTILLLAACTNVARDVKPADLSEKDEALVAGWLPIGSKVPGGDMTVVDEKGRWILVKPGEKDFLVALRPGTYRIERFGQYQVKDKSLRFEARAGEALYIGSFSPARGEDGNVLIVVKDNLRGIAGALELRYSDLPELKPGLVTSSMPPVDASTGLVIALNRKVSHAGTYYGGARGYRRRR